MQMPGFGATAVGRGRGQNFNVDHHFADGSELDAVAYEVDQNLAHARNIADDVVRNALVELIGNIERFFRGLGGQEIERFLDTDTERKGIALDLELAGLDFGKVQDIVNDRQQRFTTGVNRFHVAVLLVSEG